MAIETFSDFKNYFLKLEESLAEMKDFLGKMEQAATIFSRVEIDHSKPVVSREEIRISESASKRDDKTGVEWYRNIEKLIRQSPKTVDQIYKCFESDKLLINDDRPEEKQKNTIRSTIYRMINEEKAQKIDNPEGLTKYVWKK
jgi:hypothetical protein